MGHLHANVHGTINPTAPAVGEITTGKVDIAVGALEGREIFGGEVGGQVAPGALCKLVFVPVVSYLVVG